MFERSPLIVDIDAMNSFNVDLFPSAMAEYNVASVDLFTICRSGFGFEVVELGWLRSC
jgi:hypothetical protein